MGGCSGGGIRHLSDASLMAGHSGFRGLLVLPGVLGTARKTERTHLSLCPSSHPHIPTSLIPSSPPSYAHFTICIIQHVMLLCHFVFSFSADSAIFKKKIVTFFAPICCSLPALMEWKEKKKQKTMLCHFPNKSLQKRKRDERDKVEWIDK